jgi:uncharacterized protein (TIGR02466 family)
MARDHGTKIEKADVLRMFPTFVWKAKLKPEAYRRINVDILRKLDQLRETMPALVPGQAWQSNQNLHELDEFQELVSCIDDTSRSVLEFLKVGCDAIRITALWANIIMPRTGHRMHSHPNNFLSGVYYLQSHQGADTINFHDPRSQTGVIRPPVTELTAENTDQVVVKVKNGTLLVFPAWVPHSVDANTSKKARISMSFNITLSSSSEDLSKPLW